MALSDQSPIIDYLLAVLAVTWPSFALSTTETVTALATRYLSFIDATLHVTETLTFTASLYLSVIAIVATGTVNGILSSGKVVGTIQTGTVKGILA